MPLVNPQRGIFKPRQMRDLLSIRTVFPRSGARVWYDDQRQVHRQIFESDEAVDYAFMGQDPGAADNRWLREAYEHEVPAIYFLGRSEDHTSELQSLMRISYAVFCLQKKDYNNS